MAKKLIAAIRIVVGTLAAIVLYIIFSIVASEYLFPVTKPDLTDYFRPGDKFVSKYEGFEQTVLAVNNGWLQTRLEVMPHAAGPPEHIHEAFSETFTVKSGTLSILVNGEKRTLNAGETFTVPPMTRHKPFNETDKIVIIESDDPRTLPIEFGYLLTQLYGFMDSLPNGPTAPHMMMQFSVYGNDADSYLADGPSISVQKAMRVIMEPTARLLGYRNYYEEYRPKRTP